MCLSINTSKTFQFILKGIPTLLDDDTPGSIIVSIDLPQIQIGYTALSLFEANKKPLYFESLKTK